MEQPGGDPKSCAVAWLKTADGLRAMNVASSAAAPSEFSLFAPDFALSKATPWFHGTRRPTLELPAARLPKLLHRAEPSSAEFAQTHEDILARIARGDLSKVVPIVGERLDFAAPLNAAMFAGTITRDFPRAYNYGFDFAGEGFCGVTPEILFSVRDGVLETMALAGTGPSDGPPLIDDAKERHEHQLVIDHLTLELRRFGEPEIGRTEERPYGILKHLYTPLRLKLRREVSFMELVVRLHPTAALGGFPRRPAVEWLEAQSFHLTRRRFGAPFGFVDGGEMFCVVAIRGLQWEGARAWLSAGCGVVAGSQALREWNELQLKRRATCAMLGLDL